MPDSSLTLRSWRLTLGLACGGTLRHAMVIFLLATAPTAVCTEDAADDRGIQLRPLATTPTPLSESGGVALVSEQVACTFDRVARIGGGLISLSPAQREAYAT